MALAQTLPLLAVWWQVVSRKVTEPYLDEVFHVGQVKHYLNGRFGIWDPKITTPPGLYLLSCAVSPSESSLTTLRALGAVCLLAVPAIVFLTYVRRGSDKKVEWSAKHSALNISLLPPLFFFSALYYTDVPSALSVLIFYWYFLQCFSRPLWWQYPILISLGLISSMFRQTNIFWIALFPAGLVLVQELDRGPDVVKDSMYRRTEGFGDTFLSVARTSWRMNVVFDPSVRDAWIEDYFKTILSIAVCGCKVLTAPRQLSTMTLALMPYLTLIGAFAAFIVWNGGVVLGDKSNHIATLHLPQMLYIWPYFTFFSWPMLYPFLSAIPLGLIAKLTQFAPLESMLIFKRRGLVPRFQVTLFFISAACLIVHFNTIVHPFILADNRHYIFYVFRLLTRRWWVKYAVTPIYLFCGWACVQALGVRPFDATPISTAGPDKQPDTTSRTPYRIPNGQTSASLTFVMIWLATTTLQLVTAPLVEPRYFILPWIFWRMHVPLQQYTSAEDYTKRSVKPSTRFDLTGLDHRLFFETSWFLVISAITGYIFLNWEFAWPQEPGKLQRFMW